MPDPGQVLQRQLFLRKGVFPAKIGLDGPVDVVPAQVVVPGHGHNLYHIVKAFHIGQIQRPAPEVEDYQRPVFLSHSHPIGQGRR